jgi:hypothetical protein
MKSEQAPSERANGRAQRDRPLARLIELDQYFETSAMKRRPTEPSPVMESNPFDVVSVTSRVAQFPVPSQ